MTLTQVIAEVIAIFDGLPAELILVITAAAVVGAAARFYRSVKRASN